MKNIIILLVLFTTILCARQIEGVYKVKFGLFGKVATAIAKLENNDTHYKASLNIVSTGIAKYLSKGRIESYSSEGKIEENIYKPVKFYKSVQTKKKHYIREYSFNYEDNKLLYIRVDKKNNSKSSEELDYFTNNDLITIFLNMNSLVNFDKKENYIEIAYKKKEQRKIKLEIPQNEDKKKIQKLLKTKYNKVVIAIINQKIFSSSKGELLLALDDNNVVHKAILKDVVLFGDIKGELVSYKITP